MTAFIQTNLYQRNTHCDRCHCIIVCSVCVLCCMCNSVVEKNKIEVFVKFVIFKCHLLNCSHYCCWCRSRNQSTHDG